MASQEFLFSGDQPIDAWTDLVMYDNISFEFKINHPITDVEARMIKCHVMRVINNSYGGKIKRERLNLNPTVVHRSDNVEVNVSYEDSNGIIRPLPQAFPRYILGQFPDVFQIGGIILSNKRIHAV